MVEEDVVNIEFGSFSTIFLDEESGSNSGIVGLDVVGKGEQVIGELDVRVAGLKDLVEDSVASLAVWAK